MREKFINFLKSHNAYEHYCQNIKDFGRFDTAEKWFRQILDIELNPYGLISGAFLWRSGEEHWRELDEEWTQILKDDERKN